MAPQIPEVNSRPFFLAVPETVARNPDLTPAAKCVAGSIYTRTVGRNIRPGSYVLIRADWIAAEWAMSADAVTAGIKQLESAGIVERNRTRAGNVLRWANYEIPEIPESGKSGIEIPEKAESHQCDSAKNGITRPAFRKKRNQDSANSGIMIPQKPECTLIPDPRPELRPEEKTQNAGESVLAEIARKPDPIPADIVRMASTVNATDWIGQVQFQRIPWDDWRIRETLGVLHASGGNKGSQYAWGIFRKLPETRPAPSASGQGANPAAPPESIELMKARAGLTTARRLLPRGECTAEDVQRYERRVEELERKAAIS